MFGLGTFHFKVKAKDAMKGNWQTGMLVAFFSGIFVLALDVYRMRFFQIDMVEMQKLLALGMYSQLLPLLGITRQTVLGFFAILALLVLFTPALTLGCNHYFVCRIEGEELGFRGLFSRFCIFFKALLLYFLMGLKVFLWGLCIMGPLLALLFLVPQVSQFLLKYPLVMSLISAVVTVPPLLAMLRYVMAPFILAQEPDMGAWQAIEKSKELMKTQKLNYVMIYISFFGWIFLSSLLQVIFSGTLATVGLVASLFLQTWLNSYINASFAVYYLVLTKEHGASWLRRDVNNILRKRGMDVSQLEAMHPEETEEEETGEPGEDDNALL